MRYAMFSSVVAMTIASLASGQSGNQAKKPSATLATAQFVSVEPYSGTDSPAATAINDPHGSVDDREAVANVQKAILNWGQYKITIRRSEADLVVFVRKGRIASAHGGIHVHAGSRNSTPGDPTQSDDYVVGGLGGGEIGPNEDIFWVYSLDPDGKLTGPIWRKNLKDGLDPQELVLFESFKKRRCQCRFAGEEPSFCKEKHSLSPAVAVLCIWRLTVTSLFPMVHDFRRLARGVGL